MTVFVHGIPHILQGVEEINYILIIPDKFLVLIHQNLVYQSIGQPTINMDNYRQDFVIHHLALWTDMHFTGHGESIHTGIQAANAIGKSLRQHRNHSIYQINTGASSLRLYIQRLLFPYIPAHISNIDTKEEAAIIIFLYVNTIIQILGILAINGDNLQITPILTALLANVIISVNGLRNGFGGLLYLLWEGFGQIILAHNGQNVHPRLTLLPQHLNNSALSLEISLWPLGYFHHNLGTSSSPHRSFFWNINIILQSGIIWHHKAKTAAGGINTYHPAIGSLYNLNNTTLSGVTCRLWYLGSLGQLYLYCVPVHSRSHIMTSHKYICLILHHALWRNEAKALAVNRHLANNVFICIAGPSLRPALCISSATNSQNIIVLDGLASLFSSACCRRTSLSKGLLFHGYPPCSYTTYVNLYRQNYFLISLI